MKKLFLTLFSLASVNAFAQTTHYVDSLGSNSNPGTISSPWATLSYACTQVSTAGDTIHVNSGTYNEPNQCVLAAGVNIYGVDTNHTKINLGYYVASISNAAILLSSTVENTPGNQSISNIYFSVKDSCFLGILIEKRGNVSLHDCVFTNFYASAVRFSGDSLSQTIPRLFSTGNSFYNNHTLNCSDRQAGGNLGGSIGAISIDGQQTLRIYNNTIDQSTAGTTHNGDWIGGAQGFCKDVKIYNNKFYHPLTDGNSNNIGIEIWHDAGEWEFYGNLFSGGGAHLDPAYDCGNIGSYSYAWYVHDNTFLCPSNPPTYDVDDPLWIASQGIGIETENNVNAGHFIIRNNTFKKMGTAVQITLTHGSTPETLTYIDIDHNLCDSMGYTDGSFVGGIMQISSDDGNVALLDSLFIDNNTISATAGYERAGIYLNAGGLTGNGTIRNSFIRNNIIQNIKITSGSVYGALTFYGTATTGVIDSTSYKNNLVYNYSNLTYTRGAPTVTNYTNSGTIVSNPFLNADYTLGTGSPAIDAGLNIGYPFNGSAPDIGAFETGATNIPPMANAGTNFSITLPVSSANLSGSGTDSDGTIASYLWTKISGPGSTSILNNTTTTPTVTGLQQGTYIFQLIVTDNFGATGTSTVQVIVLPAPAPSAPLIWHHKIILQ